MNIQEKLRVARQLEMLGVDIIEAGFPIASQGDFDAVRQIAETVKKVRSRVWPGQMTRTLTAPGMLLSLRQNRGSIRLFSTSEIHLKHQLRMTEEEVLKVAIKSVERAKGYTDNVEFSAMDATRSDRDYLCKVFSAVIEAGATTLNVPDTVGYTIPAEFGSLIRYVMQNVKNISQAVISVHCHNDLGLAVANSLAAY